MHDLRNKKESGKVPMSQLIVSGVICTILCIPIVVYMWPVILCGLLSWWLFKGMTDEDDILIEDVVLLAGGLASGAFGVYANSVWHNVIQLLPVIVKGLLLIGQGG